MMLFLRKILISSIFLLACCLTAFAQKTGQTSINKVARPKLVVGIVVDQMRWDYLYRYYDRYGAGGFKRLMNDGFSCEQTYIDYLPTFTAPGHSCIYTGSVPAIHGIAGNDWIDNSTGRHWYCVEDTTVTPTGGSRLAGKMSPRNLLATTITDELRLATNMRSKVFGISLKDRGSIIPAGHLANGAYWFDDSTGNLITSSYYTQELPQWLRQFNARRLPDTFISKDWTTLYPINTYTQSSPDSNRYEWLASKELAPVFPHKAGVVKNYNVLRNIPAGNTYSFAAAKACIDGNSLGKGEATDFFCLSLSTPDYIGHRFAPNSIEVEDQYLRLDKDLADFLAYLDAKVGKGAYTVFLTADHGGAHNSEFLKDLNIPAGNMLEFKLAKQLDSIGKAGQKDISLVQGSDNYQVYINEKEAPIGSAQRQKLKTDLTNWLYSKPEVAYVIDMEDMNRTPVPEPIRHMVVNGYNRQRSGVLQIILHPGWYAGYVITGTTHGSWNPYDSHIPLLWYGWGISKGSTDKTVHMQDITPTLGALLKVQVPNGCVGSVIEGVKK